MESAIKTKKSESPLDSKFLAVSERLLKSVSDVLNSKILSEILLRAKETTKKSVAGFLPRILDNNPELKSDMDMLKLHNQPIMLPKGTRFFSRLGDSSLFVIEQKPQVREISFEKSFFRKDAGGRRKPRKLELAFPYIIFVVQIKRNAVTGLWVYYANKPITSIEDYMYYPNLPDISEEHGVCMKLPKFKNPVSTALMAEKVISMFWKHDFTSENMTYYTSMQKENSGFRNIFEWEKHSKKNQWFVLNARWPVTTHTFESLLNNLQKESEERYRKVFGKFMNRVFMEFMAKAREDSIADISNIATGELYTRDIRDLITAETARQAGT